MMEKQDITTTIEENSSIIYENELQKISWKFTSQEWKNLKHHFKQNLKTPNYLISDMTSMDEIEHQSTMICNHLLHETIQFFQIDLSKEQSKWKLKMKTKKDNKERKLPPSKKLLLIHVLIKKMDDFKRYSKTMDSNINPESTQTNNAQLLYYIKRMNYLIDFLKIHKESIRKRKIQHFKHFSTENKHDIPEYLKNLRIDLLNSQKYEIRNMKRKQTEIKTKKLREDFDKNPQHTIRKIKNTTTISEIPSIQIPLEKLELFWGKENQSKGPISTDRLNLNNIYTAEEKISSNNLEQLLQPFSSKEIDTVIKNASRKTATGSDLIPNEIWKAATPEIKKWMKCIFNWCLKKKDIPQNWKEGRMILLYKKNDPQDERSWRPITLLQTIYKLFASALAMRCQKHLTPCLSKMQKGFLNINGCQQQAFTVLRMLDDIYLSPKDSRRHLSLFYVDFTNAFGSMEYTLLEKSLELMGIDKTSDVQKLFMNMNQNSFQKIITTEGESNPIYQERGVKQGCPLSPLLFIIAIDPILRLISQTIKGYQFRLNETASVKGCGYADDILFPSSDPNDIRKIADLLYIVKEDLKIHPNPSKCGITNINSDESIAHDLDKNMKVYIGEQSKNNEIPIVSNYKYLGHCIDKNLTSKCISTRAIAFDKIEEMEYNNVKKYVDLFSQSDLSCRQKLMAIKWTSFGRIKFLLPSFNFSLKFLDKCSMLVKEEVRKIFHLPPGTNKHFFYMSLKDGGLGLYDLKESLTTQRIKFITDIMSYQNLLSKIAPISSTNEAEFSGIIWNNNSRPTRLIKIDRSHRIKDKSAQFLEWKNIEIGDSKIFDYGNGRDTLKLKHSYWSLFGKLCIDQGITFDWSKAKTSFIGHNFIDKNTNKMRYAPKNVHTSILKETGMKIYHSSISEKQKQDIHYKKTCSKPLTKIKESLQNHRYHLFCEEILMHNDQNNIFNWKSGFQSKVWRNLSKDIKTRRQQIYPGMAFLRRSVKNMTDRMITTILKGRLNLLGNDLYSTIYNIRDNGMCPRQLCYEKETTAHIFAGCPQSGTGRIDRHNYIQKIIVDTIQPYCRPGIITDQAVLFKEDFQDRLRRPDISKAITKGINATYQVGELTVPFDENLAKQTKFKKEKYEKEWIPTLKKTEKARFLGRISMELASFTVGALGFIDQDWNKMFSLYNVDESQAQKIGEKIAISSMFKSYDIWKSRCFAKWNRRKPKYLRFKKILI